MLYSTLSAALVGALAVDARPLLFSRQTAAFGSCGSPEIQFADGLDGRNEPSFQALNQKDFNHGSALGIAVITGFICQQLNDKCKASTDQISACQSGATAAAAQTGGAAADTFNKALGITSNFAAGAAASTTVDAGNTTSTDASSATSTASGALSFGTCSDPSVKFGPGLDNRKATEFSFINNNQQDFAHGSALNPDIIFQFTCDTFVNKCGLKQTDATVTTCRSAQKTADALGKTGAAADSFNKALGITTNFAAVSTDVTASSTAAASSTDAASTGSNSTAASGALSFGTCTDPSVKFGPGLDNRKATEFSFINNNQNDFAHGSALNPDIIFQFTCDTFVNKCGLKQTDATVTTCRSAQKTADALGKTGAAADSFNKALGITTNFAAVSTDTTATSTAATSTGSNSTAASGALSFGTCTDPSVKFGPGLDNRKGTEFSFINNNQNDFAHGSALNPDIIFQFTCDTFVNKCGLKQTDATVTTCRSAQKTADALGKTGAAADSFNKALGITTNFASVDSGSSASSTASASAATTTSAAAVANTAVASATDAGVCTASTVTVTVTGTQAAATEAASTSSAAAAATTTTAASSSGAASSSVANNGPSVTIGICTDPSVIFGPGLDNRKATEFAFIPNNQKDFSHNSALNPAIIFQFMCDTLVNKCGFKQTDAAVTNCRSAQTAAVALGKTGAAADSFNKALGVTSNFASVSTTTTAA